MKNIHVLPTDNKYSRLYFNVNDKEFQICEIEKSSTILKPNRHIYITSDEKLPYDSTIFHTGAFYHIDFGGDVHIINKDTHYPNPNFCSRIILTTDESLFKYGVQAIDDEFLEWICKYPSCEEVDIDAHVQSTENGHILYYQIIIPKEEVLLQSSIDGKVIWGEKQETIEEAINREFPLDNSYKEREAMFIGVKYQQERSYSEEEVHKILGSYSAHIPSFSPTFTYQEWFEQFKNK